MGNNLTEEKWEETCDECGGSIETEGNSLCTTCNWEYERQADEAEENKVRNDNLQN